MLQSLSSIVFGTFLTILLPAAAAPTLERTRSYASTLEPLPPSKDPFYTTPSEYERAPPGTVLRIRQAPGNITTVIANSSASYNILYRTTDAHYDPSWAVTTVFTPFQNATSQTHSTLLSYQIPYDSSDVDASPSYAMYWSLAQTALGIPALTDDISAALGNGWYVNVPDYEGPLASFGLGIQAGHATLDSVRAVLSSGVMPKDADTKYAMWGYSGGSIASEWASELQEQYAPELDFSGLAVGGLVPNLTSARDNLTGTIYAGLIPSVYLGLTTQNEDAYNYLVSRLKTSGPFNASAFLAARTYDATAAFAAFASQNIYDYFIGGKADLEAPIIQDIANRNLYMGYHGVPQMPVFSYKAIHDEFTNVNDTDALVERWCGIGVDVRYERNTVGGHIAEITNGRLRALAWLKMVFDGTVEKKGCDVRNVTVALTDNPA